MAVLEPVKVRITNFPSDHPGSVDVPNFPADESRGIHKVPITDVIFIEQDDFKEASLLIYISLRGSVTCISYSSLAL